LRARLGSTSWMQEKGWRRYPPIEQAASNQNNYMPPKANIWDGIILGIWTCLNRVCVGRSGELAIQSYDCMMWNDAEGGVVLEWHEIKTTDKKESLLSNDFKNYQRDQKFMFFIIDIGNCKKMWQNFIFPSLAALSKPSKKLNTAVKKLIRPTAHEVAQDGAIYVDGLDPATTATSIQSGAISDLVADWKNVTFGQLACNLAMTILTFVLCSNLFGPTFSYRLWQDNLGLHGRLWRFTVTCAATLIMYYPTFKSEVGANHFVVWHIDIVLQKIDISSAGVQEWSEQIRSSWEFFL
jgi:hypothetical protein